MHSKIENITQQICNPSFPKKVITKNIEKFQLCFFHSYNMLSVWAAVIY